jgi:hypothetical protein
MYQLYAISPILVVAPFLVVGFITHLAIESSKQNQFNQLQKIVPVAEKKVPQKERVVDPQPMTSSINVNSISKASQPNMAHKTRRNSVVEGMAVLQQLHCQNESKHDHEHMDYSDAYLSSGYEKVDIIRTPESVVSDGSSISCEDSSDVGYDWDVSDKDAPEILNYVEVEGNDSLGNEISLKCSKIYNDILQKHKQEELLEVLNDSDDNIAGESVLEDDNNRNDDDEHLDSSDISPYLISDCMGEEDRSSSEDSFSEELAKLQSSLLTDLNIKLRR